MFLHNYEFELLRFGDKFENLDGFITWVFNVGYKMVLGFYILNQPQAKREGS